MFFVLFSTFVSQHLVGSLGSGVGFLKTLVYSWRVVVMLNILWYIFLMRCVADALLSMLTCIYMSVFCVFTSF
jgi:hypothetical protein